MIYPNFLKEKDTIGVPAPSKGANDELKINRIKNAVKRVKSLGYNVELSKNAFKNNIGRSATKEERAKEFNEMLKDKNINMIIALNGGEFLVEMLPYVNFDFVKESPKYVCGFSDPTGLLFPITTKYDVATIYGSNFSSLGAEKLLQSDKDFLDIIKGNLVTENSSELYEEVPIERVTGLECSNLTEKVYWKTLDNKEVNIKGRIIGGCFDIISELAGTKYDGTKDFNEKYKDDGIIWYFDNCELSMEETIRTLWKLNELEYFKYTKCIIFGRFGSTKTYFDYDVKSCLEDSVISNLGIKIIYDADISHKAPCLTIINGAFATIKVKNGKGSICFELK